MDHTATLCIAMSRLNVQEHFLNLNRWLELTTAKALYNGGANAAYDGTLGFNHLPDHRAGCTLQRARYVKMMKTSA